MQTPVANTTDKPVTSFKDLDLKSGFRLNQINRTIIPDTKNETEKTASITEQEENVSLNSEYNDAILFTAVKKYLKIKADEKQFQVVAMLTEQYLKFENQKLIVLLSNDAQHHLFDEIKQEFLDFIRKEIQNNNLQIETAEHTDNSLKKALSPMEKFNLMAQKNPLLKELKNRLDLDPTFN